MTHFLHLSSVEQDADAPSIEFRSARVNIFILFPVEQENAQQNRALESLNETLFNRQ